MPIWVQRHGTSLMAFDEEGLTALSKLKEGQRVQVHIDRVRSPEWHRLYYKRCAVVGENQEPQLSANAVDLKTRMIAGHKECVGEWNGQPMYVPARIAFDKMSAEKWQDIWPSLEAALEQQCPGISEEISGHS